MSNLMENLSLKAKMVVILAGLGIIAAAGFSVYMYKSNVDNVYTDADDSANILISRAVEMFMVSTRKFHEAFEKSSDNPTERKKILDDWNRTIFAVDEAVIHDHGIDNPRVRLIGDEQLFNYKPLGEKNTSIQIPFETEAGRALLQGEKKVKVIEDGFLRVAVPLWSNAHQGCAECHFATVENDKVDMNRQILLGTLNAYIPLSKMLSNAKSKAFTVIALLVCAILVFMGVIYVFVNRSAVKPISAAVDGLNKGAEQVASASSQVSSTSQSLAEGSSEQAASLEETSSSLEEMSSMTKQNADNASQADNLMKEANRVVANANESMSHLTSSMEEISQASEETSKIIKTIDEIAFQTNLLALNAAVEAARAGEAGAGFAVVADEVRNLAIRAADAAKNTADLIEGTVKKVESGRELVSTANEAFGEVSTSATKVGELLGEIAAASNEQAEGIEQVNNAVTEMDKVTQQNAASAEESASASEQMSAQAEEMKHYVGGLVVLVDGKAAQVTMARRQVHERAPETGKVASMKALGEPTKKKGAKPEDVIPLDEDNFTDF